MSALSEAGAGSSRTAPLLPPPGNETAPGLRSGAHEALPPASRLSANPSRRREKPQLSCNLCRRRKLRCDRQQPCSSCASRGLACTYADNPATALSLPKPAVMHDRIVQLERLVKSLIPGGSTLSSTPGRNPAPGLASAPDPDSTPGLGAGPMSMSTAMGTPIEPAPSAVDAASECGSMRVSASELRYVGGDHWAAILNSIADLKEHFDREEQLRLAQDEQDAGGGDDGSTSLGARPPHALLLYGCRMPASRAEILAALPPKSAVDRYISRYFNRLDLVHAIVHGPSFLREYNVFWTKPSAVPIVWVGLLFSMICLALLASEPTDVADGDPEHRSLQIDMYREKTVQCLVLGEYTKSGPYVLETVVHYVYSELRIRDDADKDIWFLLALEVNLAMRMGYHRDPSHFPGISPLQSEMRRRLWATVLQGDVLISIQMGMPRMISDWKYDTAEPRNLSDYDLDDAPTATLPPSRPETELTPALGVIARRRMFVVLGAIMDLTAAVQPCSYPEVMRLDRTLHEAADSIPPQLKPKPMAVSMIDTPEVIMARLFISNLFYLGQIMLHRRFLYLESPSSGDLEDVYAYSRATCLGASLATLQIQHTLDEETSPGGQLYMMRWRVSSIMNHAFLTATMVLCSILHRGPGQTLQREDEILNALTRARAIWMRASSSSHEARKAAETVSLVIARAGERRRAQSQHHQVDNDGCLTPPPSQQGMPGAVPASFPSVNSSGGGAQQGQDMLLQDNTSLGSAAFDPEQFVMPGPLGNFTPPDVQGQAMISFGTGLGTDNMGITLDEWIQMDNGQGGSW